MDVDKKVALEKTNLYEESGKCILICKKGDMEMKEFIDFACKYLNEEITEQARHNTHTEIRRAISTRWSTQIQQFGKEIIVIQDDQPLPRKPPNAWQNRVVIINDPNTELEFSALPKQTFTGPASPQKNV